VVKEFVADVFRVNSRVNPVNAAMRPANPLSLLEGGAQLIQQRFAGQPDMQAELFGVVGGVFSDMGAYKLAVDYDTHRIEALNLSHADNDEQARALLALAQAQVDDRQTAEAEPRALRVLQLVDPESPLGADARVLLADIELKLARSEDSLKRLESIEAWLLDHRGPPTSLQAKVLALRGRHQIRLNQAEQAFDTFQHAIDVALAAEGRLSLTAVSIRLIVAERRSVSTRDDLARPPFDAAMAALHELGGAHEARALMAAAQFAFKRKVAFDHGTNAEALASIDASRQRLAALPFPTPEGFAHRLDFMAGNLRFYWGEIGAGLGLVEASVPRLMAVPHSPGEEGVWEGSLANGLLIAGRHEEADPLLRKALESAIQSGWGRHPYTVGAFVNVAKNLRMKGDHEAAATALAAIPTFDAISGEGGVDPGRYGRFADWERAMLLEDQGKHAQAIKLLRAQAPKEEGGFAADLREYHEALGVALCGGGDQLHGLPYLTRALGDSAKLDESHYAPWTARLRAEAGLCALAVGQVAMARDMARQAHDAFSAQPDVSPYYKAPSQKLDRLLGIRHVASKG
jgi:tetratricopeptide (TPR) repeat protein